MKARTRHDLWFGLILAVVLLIAYRPAWHGTPIFDDAMRIPKPADRSVAGLARIWTQPSSVHQYHPLVDTAFWAETRVFKQRMLGYHLVNVLLHATAALLLLEILRQLAIPGAWLAATLFGLHPVQVESVAFLAQMKNTLSAVFLLAALLAYLRYDRERDLKLYLLTWLCFVLGLFAKGTTAYLPIVVLLIGWWQRGKLEWRRDVRPMLPFCVIGIIAALGTIFFERRMGIATGRLAISMLDRFLIAGRAFWFYLEKIFWPGNLRMFYPRWEIDSGIWWQYVLPAAAVALLLVAWSVRRSYRWLWTSVIFFFLTLVPFLGFFDLQMFRFQFVSEHFEYLPMIAIVVPVSAGIASALSRWQGWQRVVGQTVVVIIVAALTIQTWQHSGAFRDAEACYRDSIAEDDANWIAHVNLAIILIGHRDLADAEGHLRKALQLNPPGVAAVSSTHLNLGQVLRQQRRFDEALREFETSINLSPDFRAYDAIASTLHQRGRTKEAIANYKKAMEIEPNSPVAPANLAWILATTEDDSLRNGSEALELSVRADKLAGGLDPFSLRALAAAHAENRNYSAAIETAKRALGLAEQKQLTDLASKLRLEIGRYERDQPIRESMYLD